MAARYPSRNREPVQRLGFDSADLDKSYDEREEDLDDNVHLPSSDSSIESSSGDKEDSTGDGWHFVIPDSDIAPDLTGLADDSSEQAGWQNVNSDSFTAQMYVDQFLPTELFEKLA